MAHVPIKLPARSPGQPERPTRSPVGPREKPSRSPAAQFDQPAYESAQDQGVFFVTQETPIIIATQSNTGVIGLLTNVKNGEKGLAQFYHADVLNSGEEIVELEKVIPTSDPRIRNGDLVYIRSEGSDEDSYCYLKGQALSHKCTWGRHKDSSTKSQFEVRILTNHGNGFLTEIDDFELHSKHWSDKFLAFHMTSAGAIKDQCGLAILTKSGKGYASRTFRAMETTLEDRINLPVHTGRPLNLPRVHQPLQHVPMKPLIGKAEAGSVMKECPYCQMILSSNSELINHLESVHTRPTTSVRTSNQHESPRLTTLQEVTTEL